MGSEAVQGTASAEFKVKGMHCEACVNRVRKFVLKVPGVESATVNLTAESAQVTYQPGTATPEAIAAAITSAGYKAEPSD